MTSAPSYLTLSIPYGPADEDGVIKIAVEARSGAFSGRTEGNVSLLALTDFADSLRGFPRANSDKASLNAHVPGDISLEFQTTSRTGHIGLRVGLRETGKRISASLPQDSSAAFWIGCDAEAAKRFQSDLEKLSQRQCGEAKLIGSVTQLAVEADVHASAALQRGRGLT